MRPLCGAIPLRVVAASICVMASSAVAFELAGLLGTACWALGSFGTIIARHVEDEEA